ncbi:MAG: type II toxin-antitoxin system HicA family toxin [Xanthobacteraceae bacterium]
MIDRASGKGVMLTNSRDIIRPLRHDGFEEKSIRGSHYKFVHPVSRRVVIVPHPRKDVPLGTARSIYNSARWQKD